MKTNFYDKGFDDATAIKLEIFRRYIREWLPVFLTRRNDGRNTISDVHIYDFFAGPGQDSEGNFGSPLIVVSEIKSYCAAMATLKNDASVRMVFNDIDASYIQKLKLAVQDNACAGSCCSIEYSNLPFSEALELHLPAMTSKAGAHLIIMDQFGIKDVPPGVVRKLALCENTDILFFVSTSFIHRFSETPEIKSKFTFTSDTERNLEYRVIHRHLCDYYRKQIGTHSYFLAPFSIKKGSNIYGVVFGTKHLVGLEKFLRVCWSLDSRTGEANYNIDDDSVWGGQLSLFDENNHFRKVDLFERELKEFVLATEPSNIELNKFCLLKGFPPPKAGEVLADLQQRGELEVRSISKNAPARKGAFYLGWDNCRDGVGKVQFYMKDRT